MLRKISLLLCICLLTGQALAKNKEPLILEPSGAWVANYAEDSCTLARSFGEGDNQSFLVFSRFSPSGISNISISGKPFKAKRGTRTAKIQFGKTQDVRELDVFSGSRGDYPALIFKQPIAIQPFTKGQIDDFNKALKEQDFEAASLIRAAPLSDDIDTLLVSDFSRQPVLLKTGSMVNAMATQDKCIDDLVTSWGIDAEKHKTLTQLALPVNAPQRWIKSSDYPTDLLRKGNQGIVNFRLIVSPEGEVESCHIQESSRPQGFDDAVCTQISRRAKFSPALDAEGKAITSYYTNKVTFQIP